MVGSLAISAFRTSTSVCPSATVTSAFFVRLPNAAAVICAAAASAAKSLVTRDCTFGGPVAVPGVATLAMRRSMACRAARLVDLPII